MAIADGYDISAEDWEMIRSIGRRMKLKQFDAFRHQGEQCGWCRHPIRIRGTVFDDTGEFTRLSFSTAVLPDGVVLKGCGSRRESLCPACAAVYRSDARHLVRAGLVGGKGVSTSVINHPVVFVTLTAPSFGVVHAALAGSACRVSRTGALCPHGRPLSCAISHDEGDEIIGTPLCPECYDYVGAVLQNACTPELWRRTTIAMHRQLARLLGCTQAETLELVRLSFCRVAEFQRRGVVHLHAAIRADGPERTIPVVDAAQLAQAALEAAQGSTVTHPGGVARWGDQVDVQILECSDEGRARTVAAYVAKYATKSSEGRGALDTRIRSAEDLACRQLSPHLRRMAEVAWELGGDPDFERWNLRRHAHSLGYGGHFLSKSRGYSTTLGALRAARQQWQVDRARNGEESADRSLRARWRAVGIGWANEGEAIWAEARRLEKQDERRTGLDEYYSRKEPEWPPS